MVLGVMQPASRPHSDDESSIHPATATSTFTPLSTPIRTSTAGSLDVIFADSFVNNRRYLRVACCSIDSKNFNDKLSQKCHPEPFGSAHDKLLKGFLPQNYETLT